MVNINPAPLHIAQAVIAGLSAAMSVAILGTSAHTLHIYNTQQSTNPWWLYLWPQHFDVSGTKALVASATTTIVLSLVFLVFGLVPKFSLSNKHTLRALISLGTTIPSALLALVTVIYAHIINHNAPELDTIQTWTCRYRNSQPVVKQSADLASSMANSNFDSLCMESKFALYGTLTVFLLLSANMGLAVVTWLADKWAARKTRKEMEAGQS
ncbi:hypothetical protein B0J11DRAFT_267626 [Dendryphion nanum]|uniref:Uncharacterized protein n=1 Tax=Dendryphion nanum TaxID=256645 RepID=A0A9P9DYV9_9PLEO|nr:hypothetical protein B0J11DRAFT_267626 [Dendryphion nanum]